MPTHIAHGTNIVSRKHKAEVMWQIFIQQNLHEARATGRAPAYSRSRTTSSKDKPG